MKDKRILALRQERADLTAEASTIFATAEADNRGLTADEATRDDAIAARLEAINAEEDRLVRQAERVAALSPVLVGGPAQTGAAPRSEQDPLRGFAGAADFARAVHQASRPGALMDDRLRALYAAPTNFHQETGGTAGEGFLVPPAVSSRIFTVMMDEGDDLINLVNPENTSANAVTLLRDETTVWGATGIVARWRAEAAQMSPSKLDIDGAQVKLHELYAFVLATEELLQDAPRLEGMITQRAGEAIRYKASNAIMNGTGAGQPLGIMNAASLVTQAKESGQAAATVVANNVSKMFSRIVGAGRAIWLANQDVFPQFAGLTIGNQPVWTPPSTGFAGAPGGFLFGRPIRFVEHAQTVGTVGDLVLFNPDGYYAAQRTGGPQFASSMHLYFDYGMQAFRWTFRLGGQPLLSAAISPDNGSNTRSHAVALATRA